MTSENAKCSSKCGFRILKISRKICLETVAACIVLQYHQNTNTVCMDMCDECMKSINRFRCLLHALVHFVIDRASLFTDHRISGLPIRAKYKHCRTFWEHSCDNSPTNSNSFMKWWSSMHGVDTLENCCFVLFANSQYRSTHFLA